jgi:glycosyltransferase involved in cell wall biosynthesis
MISFVWSSKYPFTAGNGGSENYTAGQIRELRRRGIPSRILTIGHGENDGREDFPDINFKALSSKEELEELDDTLVFITYPLNVQTKRRSYAILHCPPLANGVADPLFDLKGMAGKQLLAPSKYAGKLWTHHLRRMVSRIPVVHPFAEEHFGQVERAVRSDGKIKILFAGRLMADKGIYTLLAALHMEHLHNLDYEITATTAGDNTEDGKVILKLLEAHPWVNVVPARRSPQAVAKLMAEHDMVVLPSTDIFWHEAFGIVSVEAQHAGCRVVASDAGGLPETDCGGLILAEPDNPLSLAKSIVKAAKLGPLTASERRFAAAKFTVKESVDKLLAIIEAGKEQEKTYLHLKKDTLIGKQLNLNFGAAQRLGELSKLGLRIAGDNKLIRGKTRPAGN